jgi:hypothetical protein
MAAIVALCCALSIRAGSIDVSTNGTAAAGFSSFGVSAGPFPWSDLGITASASVAGGSLGVTTGGQTAFNLPTVTNGEAFVSGSTILNLGYVSNWTGSLTGAPAASGNLNSQFVYNIGPFSGSTNLFNANLFSPGINQNLAAGLNTGAPVIDSQTVSGPGASATFGVQAQACFIVCATVASASVGFNVGTRLDQVVTANPVVTNQDLVWYSTSQTYSASDPQTLVGGAGGNVANTFNPSANFVSGLADGEAFYMNILPVVSLDMPVTDYADVALPASINANWNIFGAGGSESWALGDLFNLNNGGQFVDFNGTWDASQFDSIELIYHSAFCPPAGIACFGATFTTPTGGPPFTTSSGGGIPTGTLPPPTLTGSGGGADPGGYGNINPVPLFPPPDPTTGQSCGIVGNAVECINQVDETSTPEPDAYALLGTGLLGLAILRRRLRPC